MGSAAGDTDYCLLRGWHRNRYGPGRLAGGSFCEASAGEYRDISLQNRNGEIYMELAVVWNGTGGSSAAGQLEQFASKAARRGIYRAEPAGLYHSCAADYAGGAHARVAGVSSGSGSLGYRAKPRRSMATHGRL